MKMKLFLKEGRPEGTYVIYYPDGKIAEVRSYYHGIFHGEWRTYNEAGQLTGIASYKDGQKDGPWRIWNDKEILRFEMFYTEGRKSGIWRTWDDDGKLLTEEKLEDSVKAVVVCVCILILSYMLPYLVERDSDDL